MALFDGMDSLEDVLGARADTASNTIQNQYAKQRKKLVSQLASTNRLRGGTANYPLGDLAAGEIGDLGQVQGGLAESLGNIPAEDILDQNEFQRSFELSKLIGKLNKPSALQEALGAFGSATDIASKAAPFFL